VNKQNSEGKTRERIAALRREIHEIYVSPGGPRAHETKLMRRHKELSKLVASLPEVSGD